MEEFLLDVSVNIYEIISCFALMLASFRFSLRGYLTYTIIAAVLMAQTSYLLRFEFDLASVTPIFMLLWFIIFIWRVFRIHLFYALLMTVTGYLGYLTIQAAILQGLQIWISLEDATATLFRVKLIQLAGSTIAFAVAYLLLKRRYGFSFVPDRSDEKVELKGLNLLLLLTSIIACFFISGVAYIFVNMNFMYTTLVTVFLLIVMIILGLLYKKEMKS